jgi:hypothetical protein
MVAQQEEERTNERVRMLNFRRKGMYEVKPMQMTRCMIIICYSRRG